MTLQQTTGSNWSKSVSKSHQGNRWGTKIGFQADVHFVKFLIVFWRARKVTLVGLCPLLPAEHSQEYLTRFEFTSHLLYHFTRHMSCIFCWLVCLLSPENPREFTFTWWECCGLCLWRMCVYIYVCVCVCSSVSSNWLILITNGFSSSLVAFPY